MSSDVNEIIAQNDWLLNFETILWYLSMPGCLSVGIVLPASTQYCVARIHNGLH
jgi:hypothetical protein